MVFVSSPLPKKGKKSTLNKACHFLLYYHYLSKNTRFGHLMAYLSDKFNQSKTIFYLIKILHTDFESPCNVMEPNPCIVPCCPSYHIFNIMHINNIFNRHYIVCYIKTKINLDLDCTKHILYLLWMKQLDLFRGNIIYTRPFCK